jgi:hypothetical protein
VDITLDDAAPVRVITPSTTPRPADDIVAQAESPNRHLPPLRLVFDDPLAWAWGGEAVLVGHDLVGTIRSAGWSSRAGRCVAWVACDALPGVFADWRVDPADPAGAVAVQVELCDEHGVTRAPASLSRH